MLQRLARVGLVLVAAAVALLAGVAPAFAAPAPPRTRCELTDPRVAEASGAAVSPGGLEVVNDSGNPSTVYRLDRRCRVVGEVPVRRAGTDIEDLARGADGTLWLADTGDNRRVREQVAILRVAPDGAAVEEPLVYPDGPHDAETMILPADGRPVIVTKDLGGRSGVYTTDVPLPRVAPPAERPLALRRVADVVVPPTRTPNGGADPMAALGGGLITGGALSPDGRVVALRTYTDAWLYPVPGRPGSAASVVAALRGAPVQVPLPGEPQGEALAFEPGGTLLSIGESPAEVGPAAATRRGAVREVPGAVGYAATGPRASAAPGSAGGPIAGNPTRAAATVPHHEPGSTSLAQWVAAAAVLVLSSGLVGAMVQRERRRVR